ncbi:MAG: D-aminoacyl-tRNA deacylase [Bdellovibrionota bacterium]
MKVLLQRCLKSYVKVDGKTVGSIEKGLTIFVGFGVHDTKVNLEKMKEKIINLRIFSNDSGRFDYSLCDIKGELLLIPQFTLFADTSHGRRPEFVSAMQPKEASKMFDDFFCICKSVRQIKKVEKGIFGADMKVYVENDGPVSIMIEI